MKNLKNQFKAVLRPVNRKQLPSLIEEWGLLEEDELSFLRDPKFSKAEAVNRLASLVCDNEDLEFDAESLGVLDLICLKSRPKAKQWQAYQTSLIETQENQTYKTSGSFLKQFRSNLKGYINKADVALIDNNGIYWMRVAVKEMRRVLPSVVYVAHVQFSKYFFITKSKKAHLEAIKKALASVLQCEDVNAIPLAGKCLKSLIDLTINQHSQGAFAKYRKENQGKENTTKTSKRKASDAFEDLSIVDEESPRKKHIQEYVDGIFGPHEQPALEYVDYTLNTRFRGNSYAVGMKRRTETFHCRIRFEGTNVLEGLKNLAKLGYAEYPMKSHLANVHNSARNSFVIQQKTSDQTTLSQGSQV